MGGWGRAYLIAAVLGVVVPAWSDEVTAAPAAPSLPQVYVDTAYPQQSGKTIVVNAGGNLQAALDGAQLGDTIAVQAGATFRGPFVLPAKSGSGWIVIKSLAALPAEGTGVTPADAGLMPKMEAATDGVILAETGAHHYRFVGIELRPAPGKYLYNLVLLGQGRETALSQLPHHIVFDRCYLHGDPQVGARRGIAMNGAHLAVIDSYLSDFKEVGADSQALAGWSGPGPFKIVNNYLEGAGENVMFGGADPRIAGVVPSDIEIRGNHFHKPLSWRIEDPSYAGIPWTVKNLLELKNARRVLIEGNLLEYSWGMAQGGHAVVFTVRNDGGRAPWAVVEDVTFVNNVVRHAAGGVNLHGYDSMNPSQWSQRILIRNNLFEDVDGKKWKGDGRLFQLLRGPKDVVIEHNTGFADDSTIVLAGEPLTYFVFRNNIVNYGLYGIYGDGKGLGLAAINFYLPGSEVRRNVFIGDTSAQGLYPADNTFVGTLGHVGFVNAAGGDYELQATSPFKRGATDGTDVGVNFDLMDAGDISTPPSVPTPPSSPTAPALTVSPTTTTPGGTVTATWSGIAAPTSTDWIGLYAVGTASTAEITWIYVSCTKSAGAVRASGSCAFTVPSGLTPGSYELRLFPEDHHGRLATSQTFTVTGVTSDGTAPTVSLSPPGAGATISGKVQVTALASDNVGVTRIEFRVDGAYEATVLPPTSSFVLDTGALTTGPHTLTATAYDAAGNQASVSNTVTVVRALTATLPPGTWTFPFTGVEVLHRTTAGPLRNIWAVRVNLDAPGVRMAATAYPGSTHRTPQEWAQLVGAQIAVNGDFFGGPCNPSAPICTWGLAAGFGSQWPAASNGGGDGVDDSARGVVLFNDKSQIEFRPQSEISTFPSWAKHAVGTFGDVLRNGAVVTSPIGQECSGRPPRTFGGISQDGRTLILGTVDAYNITGTNYTGFTCQEIGAFLQELGAYHGVNFDGGNSTAMHIQGYPPGVPGLPGNSNIVNIPANLTTPPGKVGTVANHFGIFATP